MIKIKDVVDIDKFIEEEYKSNEGVYLPALFFASKNFNI